MMLDKKFEAVNTEVVQLKIEGIANMNNGVNGDGSRRMNNVNGMMAVNH